MNITELETKTREELLEMARELGLTGLSTLRKQDIIYRLMQAHAEQQGNIFTSAGRRLPPPAAPQ